MYLEFYGMREFPFTLTPNTHFFLALDGQLQALDVVQRALGDGESLVWVTGAAGSGKTLLCRRLLDTLDERYLVIYLPSPPQTPEGLLRALAEELELAPAPGQDRQQLLGLLHWRLLEIRRSGRQGLLLLDEAQILPEASLEALGLLLKLASGGETLLQVLLFGQPELNELLARANLRHVRPRGGQASASLPLLSEPQVRDYVEQRLARAGVAGPALFSASALVELSLASDGLPRRINTLAHQALLQACADSAAQVSPLHLRRALAELADNSAAPGTEAVARAPRLALGALAVLVGLGLLLLVHFAGQA